VNKPGLNITTTKPTSFNVFTQTVDESLSVTISQYKSCVFFLIFVMIAICFGFGCQSTPIIIILPKSHKMMLLLVIILKLPLKSLMLRSIIEKCNNNNNMWWQNSKNLSILENDEHVFERY
jgi:high-affinity Fe2+/Pb2+ permease